MLGNFRTPDSRGSGSEPTKRELTWLLGPEAGLDLDALDARLVKTATEIPGPQVTKFPLPEQHDFIQKREGGPSVLENA
jgi:hypothetical protein